MYTQSAAVYAVSGCVPQLHDQPLYCMQQLEMVCSFYMVHLYLALHLRLLFDVASNLFLGNIVS